MKEKIPGIICKKPISSKSEKLESTKESYFQKQSKIIINYIRSFQPIYAELKSTINLIITKEKLTKISVRYQRGFINNVSHAFDFIQYLFYKSIFLTRKLVTHSVNNHYLNDSTLSLTACGEQQTL